MHWNRDWPLLAIGIGAAYPFTPALLFTMAGSPAGSSPTVLSIGIGAAAVLAIPAVGVSLLSYSAGRADTTALHARMAGVLMVVAPALVVLAGVSGRAAGASPGVATALWYVAWFLGALGLRWRMSMPGALVSAAVARRLRRVHRAGAIVVTMYAAVHLTINLTAWHDLQTYNHAATWFRGFYRTPIGEPLLLMFLALQLGSGFTLALDMSVRRLSFDYLGQLVAGLYVGTFATAHTIAVAVLGRTLLDRGADFTFASAGPGGVLASASTAPLAPYYALAVIALFIHLARPARLAVSRLAGAVPARMAAAALVCGGILVSGFLLAALISPR
jgi:succinate dehydrogenase/fumarate reductase cytochrome b subunit